MEQLLLHLFGDFILQNDYVGVRKKEKSLTGLLYCTYHCITYALPFLLITNWKAVIGIGVSHFLIDRWNIVGHFIKTKNFVDTIENFGYRKDRPFAVAIWLYIIQDNTFHLMFDLLERHSGKEIEPQAMCMISNQTYNHCIGNFCCNIHYKMMDLKLIKG